jgi:hypothetical protein
MEAMRLPHQNEFGPDGASHVSYWRNAAKVGGRKRSRKQVFGK